MPEKKATKKKATKKKLPAKRGANGQFLKGESGNPAGKPMGAKNQITVLRQNTELALRKYLDSPVRAAQVYKALDRIFQIAEQGDDREAIAATKIILDKLMPNARLEHEESAGTNRPIAIQIVNATDTTSGKPVTIIDGERMDDDG